MIGKTLSQYRIVEKIGAGGMGEVYKAHDERLDRNVAIKVLRKELASDPERLRRFEQEARAASALDHPNIITIHDIAESEGVHYIVMQFVEGKTLRDLLFKGHLPTEKLLEFATQIAEGLAKAHAAGIIHRDLKPENLMVTADGYVKILDFGLAKLLPQPGVDSEAATITKEGTVAGAVMGTASYMSPEQALGKPLDTRTDIFSLGAVLYEMATGKRAFQGETSAGLFNEILNKTPVMPSSLSSELPGDLDRVINRALSKEPGQRYPSAKELSADLNAVRKDSPLTEASAQKSIVVLPFENMSPDPEQEYFSDGLTEEVITDLSQIHSLRVISRNSAKTFKGSNKDTRTIGRELNVQYVLEGSVRKAGNNLRITAQLIDAENDAHLWAEKYSGTLDDVFDMQEKVSRSIVDALKVKITPEENERIAERPIDNVRAYECYLKAREEMWKWSEEGLERAKQLIESGLRILGENELFYVALGTIHTLYIDFAISTDTSYLQKAEEYAGKTFALNPDSSHGHYLMGYIHWRYGKIKKAAEEAKKSLAIDPNDPDALWLLAYMYAMSGKESIAGPLCKKALEYDPLNALIHGIFCVSQWYEGKFADALETWRAAHELDPENPFYRFWYAYILSYNHRFEEANKHIELLKTDTPPSIWTQLGRFFEYALQGDRVNALQSVTEELKSTMQMDHLYSLMMADCYALIDERDEALRWVEQASNIGLINYPFLNEYDPFLESIRGEPGFQKLMQKVKYKWEHFEV